MILCQACGRQYIPLVGTRCECGNGARMENEGGLSEFATITKHAEVVRLEFMLNDHPHVSKSLSDGGWKIRKSGEAGITPGGKSLWYVEAERDATP